MICHNSFISTYRTPFGAVRNGTEVNLAIEADLQYTKCTLRIWEPDSKERLVVMNRNGRLFKSSIFVKNTGLYWYYFILQTEKETVYYCAKESFTGGTGCAIKSPGGSFQITVYDKNFSVPQWFKGSVMYQIFPDRFCREGIHYIDDGTRILHKDWEEKPYILKNGACSQDFFGGNFEGIISKLQYLKELGIDVLYINPIFESSSNHRYDTGDYIKTDYMLGSEDAFKELVDKADKLNIKIILDGVFNHTGSDSVYFNKYNNYKSLGAFQSENSPYYEWYSFEKFPDKYKAWWGIKTLPDVDEEVKSYQDFIFGNENSVIDKWMNLGVAGWRLDVADELPDVFLNEFYKKEKEINKDSVLIGEVWEDASNKISYGKLRNYCSGYMFDSFMNYPLRNLLVDFITYGHRERGFEHKSIDGAGLGDRIMNLYSNYPRDIFYSLMNFLGTHDTNRILTILEEWPFENMLSKKEQRVYEPDESMRRVGIKRLKLAYAFIACFPGVPCIYYGDETYLEGYRDPFNRGTYPWGHEDKEGIKFFSRLNMLRRSFRVFKEGDLSILKAEEDLFCYERKCSGQRLIFMFNRSLHKPYEMDICFRSKAYEITVERKEAQSGKIRIEPLTYRIFIEEE